MYNFLLVELLLRRNSMGLIHNTGPHFSRHSVVNICTNYNYTICILNMRVADGVFHDNYSVKNAACIPFVKKLIKCMERNGPTITS